jgi:hypothetical protein
MVERAVPGGWGVAMSDVFQFFQTRSPNDDRPYEGVAATKLKYAVGAKFAGVPWIVTVPTNLVWLKNDTYCLPCYPLKECASH